MEAMGQATQTPAPTPAQGLALYERMLLIRRMEEKLSADSWGRFAAAVRPA
jgi:TPP-dependent pyruvate/acetoin dehydrogenase alpha subunit